MKPLSLLLLLLLSSCSTNHKTGNNWHQPAGPNGNWILETSSTVPTNFSVTTGENIAWTTDLPEGGQSAITVWENKIFLTVMKPVEKVNSKKDLSGADILALCVNTEDGKILWQREVKGSVKSGYMYGFSDSSTPGPVTDGKHVWFYNASGNLSCFDFTGKLIWERTWKPVEDLGKIHYPFNKQFEPYIDGNILINMETYWKKDAKRVYGWNYLYGIDKTTGKELWISEDGLTHYNTPFMAKTADGKAAIMIGRGGHHKVPEAPQGYSLIDISNGKRIWKYDADKGQSLYNSTWNEKYAIWYTEKENEVHMLDSSTGKHIKKISITENADVRTWNSSKSKYELKKNFDFSKTSEPIVFPAWYTNRIVNGKLFFMCFKKGRYRKNIGPEYSFAKIDLNTGKAEYLEVPVHYELKDGKKEYIWNTELSTETINNKGLNVAQDKRSQRDGWHWNFNGNPICVNNKIFFTSMLGVTYCIDADTESFDESAFISINDLGPKGKTWSVNSPSFANGRLYHRTLKKLICIEQK
ncbi:MAG: PQQ-binding-like beta-propeller repeat protein [Lentisphaeraceae bacterium]|nr:PQQ-binding-like beta-propeller repeat protein [Lentisphaeraceae bacterium]